MSIPQGFSAIFWLCSGKVEGSMALLKLVTQHPAMLRSESDQSHDGHYARMCSMPWKAFESIGRPLTA